MLSQESLAVILVRDCSKKMRKENNMEEKEAKQVSLELMKVAEAAYLSTINGDGFPETRVMANLRNAEQYPELVELFGESGNDFLVYLTTSASSEKIKQIQANPKASLYFSKVDEIDGLMLAGTIEVADDPKLKKQLWQDGWEIYWPGGVGGAEFTILCLVPEFAKGWHKDTAFEFDLK